MIPQISPAEWEVMRVLWKNGPQKSSDIVKELSESNKWQNKTIQTMLHRLLQKGVISYTQSGKTYTYEALFTEKEAASHETKGFIQRVFKGNLPNLVLNFVEHNDLTEVEAQQLLEILNKRRM